MFFETITGIYQFSRTKNILKYMKYIKMRIWVELLSLLFRRYLHKTMLQTQPRFKFNIYTHQLYKYKQVLYFAYYFVQQ